MSRSIFVNLPVKDLERSTGFYKQLGFGQNLQFSDETAACIVISDEIYAMLLTEPKFQGFAPREISDATQANEVLLALSCESRDEVDDMVRKAVAGGGATYNQPQDLGFMYSHGFQDPDGHVWEVLHMDPSAISQT